MVKKIILFGGLFLLTANIFAFDESTAEFARAEKQFEARQYLQAEASYRQALEKYKNMGDLAAYIKNRIGDCCQYEGKTEDAVQMYKQIQLENKTSPIAETVQEKIAKTYYRAENYDKAAGEFEKLAEQTTRASVQGSSATKGNMETALQHKKNKALGYASLCYSKAGKKIEAFNAGRKMKNIDGATERVRK